MKKQQIILEYIRRHPVPSPTVREIGKAVGLKSSSTVHTHLTKLKEKGLITWEPTCPRTIILVE